MLLQAGWYMSRVNHCYRQDRDTHIEASKVALTAMLKSWAGDNIIHALIWYDSSSATVQGWFTSLSLAWSRQYLGCCHWLIPLYRWPVNALHWLVHSLPHPQKGLLEVFFDVFQIRLPEWTECFIQVLKSVGECFICNVLLVEHYLETSRSSHDWTLSEGWVAEEGKYLLPPRITSRWVWLIESCDLITAMSYSRTNLVVCYLSMLLFTLMNCGLSKVCGSCDPLLKSCDLVMY